MMGDWFLSSLAVGATIVLYGGNPNYPVQVTLTILEAKGLSPEKITILLPLCQIREDLTYSRAGSPHP